MEGLGNGQPESTLDTLEIGQPESTLDTLEIGPPESTFGVFRLALGVSRWTAVTAGNEGRPHGCREPRLDQTP